MIDLHSITLNQRRIQGIFGAFIPVWVPFCVKFIESRTSYTLTFESSMVWPKKTTEISHKKEKKLQPKPPCAVVTSYQTCDRWPFKKTWTLFMRVSKLLISIRNSCWGGGGMDCYRIFVVVVIFTVKKKLNQLKTKFQEVFS